MTSKTLEETFYLTVQQQVLKRIFDTLLSLLLLPMITFPVLILIISATVDTRLFGLFFQSRVGQQGKVFTIFNLIFYIYGCNGLCFYDPGFILF